MSERKLLPMIAVATPISLALLWGMDAVFDWFVFAVAMAIAGFLLNTFYAIGTE